MAVRRKNNNGSVNLIEGIIIGILILLIAAMLFLYFSFSKSGAAPNIFGLTIYQTKAVNMAPEVPASTAIIAKASEIDNIKVGSAILCKIGDDTILTRVVQIISDSGEISYVVRFDTAAENDTFLIPRENVIAKAIWYSAGLGKLLTFATSTFGITLVIIIPSFIIIVFQVVRIINLKREEEDSTSLDDLEDIMIDNDEKGGFVFSEPKIAAAEDEPHEKTVLTVDKHGKAGFGTQSSSHSPLFTYDNIDFKKQQNNQMNTAVPLSEDTRRTAKPVKVQKTSAGAREDAFPLNSSVEVDDEPIISDEYTENNRKNGFAGVVSTVLPEQVKAVSSSAQNPQQTQKEPLFKKEQSKTVSEPLAEKLISETSATIPDQAAIPSEKLAPPKKKSNSKALSELLGMIDAEETKLNK